jgi:hypothetical protein
VVPAEAWKAKPVAPGIKMANGSSRRTYVYHHDCLPCRVCGLMADAPVHAEDGSARGSHAYVANGTNTGAA